MANDKKHNKKHLYYLDELSDYKVDSHYPDVRGWDVKDADNRVIGKVDNLLVNKEREQVVYLDVEVDDSIIEADHDPYGKPANEDVHEFVNKEGESHIIVPIGFANINEDQEFVYTDKINYQTFAETKRIEKGANVNRDYEVIVLDSYDRNNPNQNKQVEYKPEKEYDEEIRNEGSSSDEDRYKEENRNQESRENQRKDFETRPDDSYDEDYRSDKVKNLEKDLDTAWRDGRRKEYDTLSQEKYEQRKQKGRNSDDDDSFYERREFDQSNFRRGRRK